MKKYSLMSLECLRAEVLLHSPLPEDLLNIDAKKLDNLLKQVTKGRYGNSSALTKAKFKTVY